MPQSPIGLPSAVRRVSHLAQRRLGEEVVVMDLRAGKLYGFNVAGGELLDWLKPGQDLASLKAGVAEGAPEIESFVGLLVEHGLVDGIESGEGSPEEMSPIPPSLLMSAPKLLWQEEAVRVTNQTSPPQAITNPQCQP